jgi:hypothetical protein
MTSDIYYVEQNATKKGEQQQQQQQQQVAGSTPPLVSSMYCSRVCSSGGVTRDTATPKVPNRPVRPTLQRTKQQGVNSGVREGCVHGWTGGMVEPTDG